MKLDLGAFVDTRESIDSDRGLMCDLRDRIWDSHGKWISPDLRRQIVRTLEDSLWSSVRGSFRMSLRGSYEA